ncbi:MAG TPA: transglycosylase domain-containing protein, partial [Longimicrobiaceae bacterium]|nr:transglycosylase domain-containing protein [Longimicrobiaceae bacterium]
MSRKPAPRKRGARKKKKAGASAGRRIFQALLLVLLLGVVGAGAGLAWLWPRCSGPGCPSVDALRNYSPPMASRVFDRDGALVAHLAPERRILVPLERIPQHVSGAFLAVEDRRFYRHRGIDARRVAGALARNVRSFDYDEVFSTITMQLARNVFPEHLSREKTLRRKLWEVVLARD